jgi:wyosine [tRNA(Phe)-imidazoG37] synthetase (radical SAM superfamily)
MEDCKLVTSCVFGPLTSRRLGSSLGINVLPLDTKVCNFDCIYCECGWTDLRNVHNARFPDPFEIRRKLEENLKELRLIDQLPDSITFSGNGEPTLHPHFDEIVNDVIRLRDKYSPGSVVTVFTNGTLLNRKEVVEALRKVDNRIVKFDAGTQEEFNIIDQPLVRRSIDWMRDHLKYFNSKVTIQSLFLKGSYKGKHFDNTQRPSVDAWLNYIEDIKPELVMLYTFDRPTPAPGLEKIEPGILQEIAEKVEDLGIRTQVNW